MRRELALESLECRQVMSAIASPAASTGQPLDMISVSPGDGQCFSAGTAPQQIVVGLEQPRFAGLPSNTWWSDGTIRLERVGSDGVTGTDVNPSMIPTAILDATARTATIPLPTPLEPGRYRIVLAGGSPLSQALSSTSWDPTEDHTLAEFEVVGKGPTLGGAVDLGEIGSTIRTASGSLDLENGVALYKITLGSSQPLWRLGLQVDAQRIGSPLRSAITLFDQQGRALASRSAGAGLGAMVNDPYLFAGLKPGVYYVGVSGAGNLGGQPDGYDPTTGAPGASTSANATGAFQLEYVADPVTSATNVVGFSLQSADPTSASPTGFTISFSQAIDPASLEGDPLFVQDQQGRLFPVILGSIGPELNQLEFWFNQPLEPGRYRLVLPQDGGLADVMGRTPAGPNLPTGTLATWTVRSMPFGFAGRSVPVAKVFERVGEEGKAGDQTFAANETAVVNGSVTYRVVIPPTPRTTLTLAVSAGSLRVQLKNTDGTVCFRSDESDSAGVHVLNLKGGVYLLTINCSGTSPATVAWSLSYQLNRDAQIANAVGSSGALGLRLGATSSDSSAAPFGRALAPSFAAAGSGAITTLPSSYTVTVGSTLVGRPSGGNDAVTAVGSNISGGLVAMAAGGRGAVAGAFFEGGVGDDGRLRDAEGLPLTEAGTDDVADRLGLRSPDEERLSADDGRGDRADALALGEADRLAAAARRVAWWLFRGVEDDRGATSPEDRPDPAMLADVKAVPVGRRGEPRSDLEPSGEVERATLGAPVSVVVAAAVAFRFRQVARQWWRRRRGASPTTSKAAHAPLWRGPRYMVPPGRRMGRARRVEHV